MKLGSLSLSLNFQLTLQTCCREQMPCPTVLHHSTLLPVY